MEPETNSGETGEQKTSFFAPLTKVTTFSKFFALALFIVMPFVGGWIGYHYAPEKVVEVEKEVEIEKTPEVNQNILVCIPTGTPCAYYRGSTIITGSYPDSFEKIDDVYYKDEKQVFVTWYTSSDYVYGPSAFIVDGADSATFEPIYSDAFRGGVRLAKDNKHVYLDNKIIEGADPSSIKIFDFSPRLFADKHAVYKNGVKVDFIDATTFKINSVDETLGGTTVHASDQNSDYILKVDGSDSRLLTIEVI